MTIATELKPYFTTAHHDDERGLVTTYMPHRPTRARLLYTDDRRHGERDPAATIVVLLLQLTRIPGWTLVAGGVVAFLLV